MAERIESWDLEAMTSYTGDQGSLSGWHKSTQGSYTCTRFFFTAESVLAKLVVNSSKF